MPSPQLQANVFQKIKRLLRGRGHHFIFILSLVSMTLLLAWWTIFIRKAIHKEHQFIHSSLQFRERAHAFILGHDHTRRPRLGVFRSDPRFEIVMSKDNRSHLARSILPYWKHYVIRPRNAYLQKIEKKFRSRRLMLFGEGVLLCFLMLVSCIMLYSLISQERRSAKELREFWSRMTHEIKTPITGIKAFLETLKTQSIPKESLPPLIDLALKQIERQQLLAQNILIGQKLENFRDMVSVQPIDLTSFIENFASQHSHQLTEKELRVDIQCESPYVVQADPDAIHIILDNLTDNALKYGASELILRVVDHEGYGCIMVCDNGKGFEPKMADNLFEAYRRLKDELPKGQHGTGMGLHISRRLARKMNGELTGKSEGPGKGACFCLILPQSSKSRWNKKAPNPCCMK